MKLLLVVIAVLLIFGGMGAWLDSIYDFRTDVQTQNYTVETEADETTASLQLSTALWEGDVAKASISSNITVDAPIASSYNSTNRELTVTGLAASQNRTLDVSYDVASLTDYPGVSGGILHVPGILTAVLIVIVLGAIVAMILGIVHRRGF